MSLGEIPQHSIRRNAHLQRHPDDSHRSKPQVSLQIGDENAGVSPKPSSIQTMLRNTTETGDVGQFAVKPPRVNTSASQLSPALSTKSRGTPHRRRHPGSYHNGYHGYGGYYRPRSPGQGSIASNGSSYHIPGYRQPRRMPSVEDYQSYPMTQSSYDSHTLAHRHPHINGHHYGRADVRNIRPRSPYAYPTRLKRPGYRPPSPGFSDFNSSITGYGNGLSREPSSRTASPSSAYNLNRTPSPFRFVINRSDPNLYHYPPYMEAEPTARRSPLLLSSRSVTPVQSPALPNGHPSAHNHRNKPTTNGSWLHPQTPPASPIFYDYTEDFEQRSDVHRAFSSARTHSQQPMPLMDPGTYFEPRDSPSSLDSVEPTSKNPPQQTAAQSSVSTISQDNVNVSAVGEDIMHTAPQDLSDVLELSENEIAATTIDTRPTKHRQYYSMNDLRHRSLNLDSRTFPEPRVGISHFNAIPSPQPLGKLVNVSKPLGTPEKSQTMYHSQQCSKSSLQSPVPPLPKDTVPKSVQNTTTPSPTLIKLGTNTVDSAQKILLAKPNSIIRSDSPRDPSLEGRPKVSTEILSPTPERSIISSSTRNRFSKILSIDEGESELGAYDRPPMREARIVSPSPEAPNVMYKGSSRDTGQTRSKPSLYSRDKELKHKVSTVTLMDLSDSEEEPELTPGLRRTFCKEPEDTTPTKKSSQIILPSQLKEGDHNVPPSLQNSPSERKSVHNIATAQPIENLEGSQIPDHLPKTAPSPIPRRHPLPHDTELPNLPRKKPSFQSISPPFNPASSKLPFDFTPLVQTENEEESILEAKEVSPATVKQSGFMNEDGKKCSLDNQTEVIANDDPPVSPPVSVASRLGSRPWNQDSSYPWNDAQPELDVSMPRASVDSIVQTGKSPRFKLKVHRASSSTTGTSRLRKELLAPELGKGALAPSHNTTQDLTSRRKAHPNLSIIPGQINSSHDIARSSRQHTRFVETFETQSPTISLIPPSPNHDVRSFFSDDSSQMRPKGSLRKRFSDFRARAVAVRGVSIDESQGHDRGLLSSALGRSRASGRSSRQSQNTTGAASRTSHLRHAPWKMVDKIRLWLHRGEDRVRDWGWKIRYSGSKNQAASTPLYAGV